MNHIYLPLWLRSARIMSLPKSLLQTKSERIDLLMLLVLLTLFSLALLLVLLMLLLVLLLVVGLLLTIVVVVELGNSYRYCLLWVDC